MTQKISKVLLIDDSKELNFLHQLVINHSGIADEVIAVQMAERGLEYLAENKENTSLLPDLILLDINMLGMDGWDFLAEFEKIKSDLKKAPIIIMITASNNPNDFYRATKYSSVSGCNSKPLTEAMLHDILKNYF